MSEPRGAPNFNAPSHDAQFMRHALGLAARNLGRTWPNPAVGAVLVKNGHVIGRGWTQMGGRPHAESVALQQAGAEAHGATLYVTLEPCAHTGQTPPCAEAVARAGIARAVVACRDPDARVDGRGVAMLRQAGIAVTEGVLEAEAQALNAGFFSRIQKNRPFVALKIASTLDGNIALENGHSQWITGAPARAYGHMLRARHDAVLTGIGTILADDARLDCRLNGLETRSPQRVVMDTNLRLPRVARLLEQGSKPWVFASPAAVRAATWQNDACELLEAPEGEGGLDIRAALGALAERGVTRLLVEAGPMLAASLMRARAIDRIYWLRAPSVMGRGLPAFAPLGVERLEDMPKLNHLGAWKLGNDILEIWDACLPA